MVHDPASGPVIPKQPPDPIQEMPPDQKPAGQNVQWIPGYWSWDVSRNDYLWVSGIWRDPPPNSQWVPGYWHQVEGGNQWVSGTWIPVSSGPAQGQAQASGQGQPSYLPQAPPQSLETGPTTPQPNPNVAWTPGYWSWQGSSYAWRPGFWGAVQPNWIWMPAHYVWTPSGYLFVAGYWDLPVANRGLMFAPVYYPQPVYAQPNFVFTPSISIVGPAVTANLFVSAGTNQYLFGDFYAQNFVSVGITPWFSFSFGDGPAGLFRPAVLVLRSGQRPAKPGLDRPGSTRLHPAARQCRDAAADHLLRGNAADRTGRTGRARDGHAARPGGGRTRHAARAMSAKPSGSTCGQKVAQLHQLGQQRAEQEREGARARAAGGAAAHGRGR